MSDKRRARRASVPHLRLVPRAADDAESQPGVSEAPPIAPTETTPGAQILGLGIGIGAIAGTSLFLLDILCPLCAIAAPSLCVVGGLRLVRVGMQQAAERRRGAGRPPRLSCLSSER